MKMVFACLLHAAWVSALPVVAVASEARPRFEEILDDAALTDLYLSEGDAAIEKGVNALRFAVYHVESNVFTTLGADKTASNLAWEVPKVMTRSEIDKVNATLSMLPSEKTMKQKVADAAKLELRAAIGVPSDRAVAREIDNMPVRGPDAKEEEKAFPALREQAPETAAEKRSRGAEDKVREFALKTVVNRYTRLAIEAALQIPTIPVRVGLLMLSGETIGDQGFTPEEAEQARAQFIAARTNQDRANAAKGGAAIGGRDRGDIGHDPGDRGGSGPTGGAGSASRDRDPPSANPPDPDPDPDPPEHDSSREGPSLDGPR
jgi:hypothetical protein